jgi:hypothetical protein
MKNKGQGTIWAWLTGLVGMVIVAAMYIIFTQVIWSEDPNLGIAGVLNQTLGLDLDSQPIRVLRTSWQIWPVAFIVAWMLYMIIYSIIREPQSGY